MYFWIRGTTSTKIEVKWKSLSRVWLFVTQWPVTHQASLSMNILQARILERGCHAFLQGIFPIQGLNSGLLHCRWILYHLSHMGSPRILKWVAYHFSRGYFWPSNQTGVSCITGRFFINWATRESPNKYE